MRLEDWALQTRRTTIVCDMIEKQNNSLSSHNSSVFITSKSKISDSYKNYHFRNFEFEKAAHSLGERANYPLASEASGRWEI